MKKEKIERVPITSKVDVRSTRHLISRANTGKLSAYADLLSDCRRIVNDRIDFIWENKIETELSDGKRKVWSVQEEQLELPRFLSKQQLKGQEAVNGRSARLDKCCTTQAIGIVKSAIEKQRMRQWVINNIDGDTERVKRKYEKTGFIKPVPVGLNIEVNSINAEFIRFDGKDKKVHHFSGFLKLKSLGSGYDDIYLPIKLNKRDRYWEKKGYRLLNSFLLCDGEVWFRWSKEVLLKSQGEIIGSDQGVKDTMYLSNGFKTPVANKQGITMDDILEKLKRKRKGSKAFQRAAKERENFINWQMNELWRMGAFVNVQQVNVESIWNVNYKKRSSRKISHWSNPLIVGKLNSLMLENGVRVHEESSTYMSQRCSRCGLVKKSNRKGKLYKCPNCGLEIDADLNAALNHTKELPPIHWSLRSRHLNRKGFFWLKNGLFTLDGGEPIQSPSTQGEEGTSLMICSNCSVWGCAVPKYGENV